MAAKRGSTRKQLEGATMSRVFLDIGPEKSESVIFRALSHRSEASESVRSALNAAIDNHVKMEGFRRPSRAKPDQLREPTLYQLIFRANDKLAGALLRAWTASHGELREAVERRLAEADVALDEPDFKVGQFNSKWDVAEWRKTTEAVAPPEGESGEGESDDEDEDAPSEFERGLMVMCVSGKSWESADEIKSELLVDWLESLDGLPPDAPEWREAGAFASMVEDMAERKTEERRGFEAEAIDRTVAEINSEYGEEARYLELNLSAWTGENAMEKNAESDAKELANDLLERLSEYRPLRPQGASRAEENERSARRDELEKAILDLMQGWDALEERPPDAGSRPRRSKALGDFDPALYAALPPGSPLFAEMERLRKMRDEIEEIRKATVELSSDQSKEDVKQALQSNKEMKAKIERLESDNSELKRSNADLKSLHDGVSDENARLKRANASLEAAKADADSAAELEAEATRLRDDNARLSEEKQSLDLDNQGLRSDMGLLGEEIDELRTELARKDETENYWREAYIAASAGQTRSAMGASPDDELTSVNEALDLAQTMFPNELAIALNSKSSKNSPFRKPDEVFGALSWLATEYHRLRTNPSSSRPDFNRLLKESCPGWFYKPGQTEVTAEQFIEWYTTTVDSKTFELYHHIGKGNSHDPQHTIRIAFAWDDENQRVAVGFLGLHQRNRRS